MMLLPHSQSHRHPACLCIFFFSTHCIFFCFDFQKKKQCRTAGSPEVVVFDLDVADITALENAIHETVDKMGALSALICNAGINRRKSALTAGRRIWDQVLDTNFRSLMHATRTALPYMQMSQVANGAGIVYISSEAIQNELGFGGLGAYYSTKFAITGFAGCVFEDVRSLGIKVSIVAPGLTNTDLGVRPGPLEYQSAREMIQPDDIAKSVSYVLNTQKRVCPTKLVISPRFPQFSFLAKRADSLYKGHISQYGLQDPFQGDLATKHGRLRSNL